MNDSHDFQSESLENGFFCDQFNTTAHFKNSGPEIYEQTGCMIDAFVMGAGTGGTIAGVAAILTSKMFGHEFHVADCQRQALYCVARLCVGVLVGVHEY